MKTGSCITSFDLNEGSIFWVKTIDETDYNSNIKKFAWDEESKTVFVDLEGLGSTKDEIICLNEELKKKHDKG